MNEVVAESPKLTPKAYVVRGAAIVGGIGVLALALPAIYFAFLSSLGLLGIANEIEFKEGTGMHAKWSDVDLKAPTVWAMYDIPVVAAPTVKGKK